MNRLVFILVTLCIAITQHVTAVSDEVTFPPLGSLASDGATVQSYRDAAGRLKIKISGDRYDGRRLIKALLESSVGSGNSGLSDADLDVDVGSLIGYGGEEFRNLSLRLSTVDGRVSRFSLQSKADNRVFGELDSSSDRHPTIRLKADDAGSLFRALDLYGRIAKGRLSFTVDLSDEPGVARKGHMTLRDYSLSNESFFDDLSRSDQSAGDRFVISLMQLTFALSSGQVLIEQGYACSPRLVAEIKGKVDLARDDMTIAGRLLYAYGRELGRDLPNEEAPVFPLFLSYGASGPIGAPIMQINHNEPAVSARLLLRACAS